MDQINGGKLQKNQPHNRHSSYNTLFNKKIYTKMTGTFTVEQVVANILGDASTKYTKSSLLAALSCINSQNLQSSNQKKKYIKAKKRDGESESEKQTLQNSLSGSSSSSRKMSSGSRSMIAGELFRQHKRRGSCRGSGLWVLGAKTQCKNHPPSLRSFWNIASQFSLK